MPRARNPIDRLVGTRIRSRREEIGLSQAALGAEIGVTFQQVQKYEAGFNRVGAGRLFEISVILGASVEFFYRDAQFHRGKRMTLPVVIPSLSFAKARMAAPLRRHL